MNLLRGAHPECKPFGTCGPTRDMLLCLRSQNTSGWSLSEMNWTEIIILSWTNWIKHNWTENREATLVVGHPHLHTKSAVRGIPGYSLHDQLTYARANFIIVKQRKHIKSLFSNNRLRIVFNGVLSMWWTPPIFLNSNLNLAFRRW